MERQRFWREFNIFFGGTIPLHTHIHSITKQQTPPLQVARALVDAMTAGAASADADYVVCVALASDSPDILLQFQREFGANLIHVTGPVVHIDRRWEWQPLIVVLQLMNCCFVPHFGCILYDEHLHSRC
jgi:hypothetical protein